MFGLPLFACCCKLAGHHKPLGSKIRHNMTQSSSGEVWSKRKPNIFLPSPTVVGMAGQGGKDNLRRCYLPIAAHCLLAAAGVHKRKCTIPLHGPCVHEACDESGAHLRGEPMARRQQQAIQCDIKPCPSEYRVRVRRPRRQIRFDPTCPCRVQSRVVVHGSHLGKDEREDPPSVPPIAVLYHVKRGEDLHRLRSSTHRSHKAGSEWHPLRGRPLE